ncbi:MAG: sulfotransferase [Planctomycetaceae bacterium]
MIPRRWKPSLILSRLFRAPQDAGGKTKFILLAKQRSGSTWVIDLLNSHPDVVGYSELFDYECWDNRELVGGSNCMNWNTFVAQFHGNQGREPNRAEQVRLYPEFLSNHAFASESAKAVGFKLMYNQAISHPAIPRYLQRHRVHCIHLIRHNLLDGIVSQEAVANRGFAHAGTKAQSQATTIDPTSLVMRLKRRASDIAAAQAFAKFLNLPTLELSYESLCEDASTIENVLGFLGVDDSKSGLTSKLRKMSGSSHTETIANYEAVAEQLSGTQFESLLRP